MGKQINQYSKTRTFADLTDEDLFDVDSTDDAGTSYESAKLTVLNLIRYINNNAKTYYNENGSINEDREVSMNTFNAKWIGGNIVAQMSDAINDYGFIVNDDALVEKARLGYDQSTLSSIFSLFDSTGEYINANNGKLKVGNSPGPSTATLVVQGILNASTTNFTVYGGTLSGRTDIGVSANNPNISMFDGAGVQQMNFDSGSSSSWTLRPFGVNMVGGTARLSVKALSNGTDQAFRIRNNTDAYNLTEVRGNGATIFGNNPSGTIDYGHTFKTDSLTYSGKLMQITSENSGTDYYNFNAGSLIVSSVNTASGGFINSVARISFTATFTNSNISSRYDGDNALSFQNDNVVAGSLSTVYNDNENNGFRVYLRNGTSKYVGDTVMAAKSLARVQIGGNGSYASIPSTTAKVSIDGDSYTNALDVTGSVIVNGDIETLGNTNGLVVLDRTDTNRYRIYTDNGVLHTELI